MNQDMIFWSPGVSLEDLEKQVILRAYRHYRFNKTSTAASLKIAVRTLDARLECYESQDITNAQRAQDEQKRRTEFDLKQRGIPQGNLGMPYDAYHAANMRLDQKPASALMNEKKIVVPEKHIEKVKMKK